MNITRAFVDYMEDLGLGVFNTDIFIGSAPLDATDIIWWVVSSGGASQPKNTTGERVKNYTLNVYYRSTTAQDVYDTLQAFEEEVNSKNCVQLDGYMTVDMEAVSFPADQDLDDVDRTVGLVVVRATVYQAIVS